jgi:hypothetical protein
MNKLVNNDAYVPKSFGEKTYIIELLYKKGIPVYMGVYNTRHSEDEYRTILWSEFGGPNITTSCSDTPHFEYNVMSLNDFLHKAGIIMDLKPRKSMNKYKMV